MDSKPISAKLYLNGSVGTRLSNLLMSSPKYGYTSNEAILNISSRKAMVLAGRATLTRVMRMIIYWELIMPQSELKEPEMERFSRKLPIIAIFEPSAA